MITLLIAISVLLAACGDDTSIVSAGSGDTNSGGSTSVSLAGTWQLTSLTVDSQSLALPPTPLSITIADGTISGDAGCNTFGGTIDRGDDGALSVGQLVQTEMACEHLDFEIAYTAALMTANRWEATPDQVTFVADNASITYAPTEG